MSVTSPTSQLILQPFRRFTYAQLILQPFCCFTYVTAHSPILLSVLLRHRLLTYDTSPGESPMEDRQMITHVAAHSPTLPSLYLRHSLFSNPSAASPTSQFILQPFFLFSYVTRSSLNSPGEPRMLQERANSSQDPPPLFFMNLETSMGQ